MQKEESMLNKKDELCKTDSKKPSPPALSFTDDFSCLNNMILFLFMGILNV